MKKYVLLFLYSAFLFSCSENEGPSVCGVENPVEDLAWIKETIEESQSNSLSQYSYLIQGSYKGETVFSWGSCCPFCNFIVLVADCQGKVIEDASISEVKNQKIIWKPVNSVCTFD